MGLRLARLAYRARARAAGAADGEHTRAGPQSHTDARAEWTGPQAEPDAGARGQS